MYDYVLDLLKHPLLALFITISLGYLVGKLRYKTFVLGGISGSLIVGVIIGQIGVKVSGSIGDIFFALFIYAVGYQGGAQFFKSINRKMLVELLSATLTCVLGLLCVLVFADLFHLDRGTAAGLAAGGLTQSAMIGSASAAIGQLGLSGHVAHILQTNVAVGYAVCYIFGSFGPILLLATVFPLIMRWNLRKEAIQLATQAAHGAPVLEPGQFKAIADVSTRVYQLQAGCSAIGQTLSALFEKDSRHIAVEKLIREGHVIEAMPMTTLMEGDVVALTAKTIHFPLPGAVMGVEVARPESLQFVEANMQCILTNKQYINHSIVSIYQKLHADKCYGVFIYAVRRLGETLPLSPDLVLKRGDELELVGRPEDLARFSGVVGKALNAAPLTDFIIFGLGMAVGFLFGMVGFRLFGVSIHLGAGVGCLISGLIFGWFRSVKPAYGALPTGASNFLRDFGLAVFVAVIGLTAGPQAIVAIKSHGLSLFFLGIGVTIIPQILSFFISYYVLRIKNPITLLATIAGGRSANPGFAALLEKAGNSTPVLPFTATYALANIWLTLWGPIIIALVTKNI